MAKANPFPRRGLVGLLALGLSAAASAPARAQIDLSGHCYPEYIEKMKKMPKLPRTVGVPPDELMEYICQENNQYGIAQGFKPGDK